MTQFFSMKIAGYLKKNHCATTYIITPQTSFGGNREILHNLRHIWSKAPIEENTLQERKHKLIRFYHKCLFADFRFFFSFKVGLLNQYYQWCLIAFCKKCNWMVTSMQLKSMLSVDPGNYLCHETWDRNKTGIPCQWHLFTRKLSAFPSPLFKF